MEDKGVCSLPVCVTQLKDVYLVPEGFSIINLLDTELRGHWNRIMIYLHQGNEVITSLLTLGHQTSLSKASWAQLL